MTIARAAALLALIALSLPACRVTYVLGPVDDPAEAPAEPLANAPLDILFVIDNSASMLEESERVIRSVFDSRCPIQNLRQVPSALLNPEPGLLEDLSQVCGIAQILAAYDRDFHLGVISTDTDNCNHYLDGFMNPADIRGSPLPQRGCLQPAHRFLTRDDDVAAGFRAAITALTDGGGAGYERGLDAVEVFLTEDSIRAPECGDDLEGFLRPSARLLVTFVTDEDDCTPSRDVPWTHGNETPVCGGDPDQLMRLGADLLSDQIGYCYDADRLESVAHYERFLRGLVDAGRTRAVQVGLLGGVVERDGALIASGCRDVGGVVDGTCNPTQGNPPEMFDDPCTADAARRYLSLSRALNDGVSLEGSICGVDYRAPLIRIFQATESDG